MPADSIVFMHNLNRFWERDGIAQGVWCLRDAFKASHCTLVLLGANAKLPPELQSDVVVSTEPPPSRAEVDGIVTKILASAGKAGAKVEQTDKDAVSGALLGLDLGTHTIGTAFCDAGWRFASPGKTLPRGKFTADDRDPGSKVIVLTTSGAAG